MALKNKLVLVLTGIFMAMGVVFSSTSANAQTTDPIYESIKNRGELIVGLSADYAPYEFHAQVDGKDKIVGFDLSIAQKIAEDMGVKLRIEELGFDALLGALSTKSIDLVISGMAITEEREKEVNFSIPYMQMNQTIVVRKGDKEVYQTPKDFQNIKVAVQRQTTQEELAQHELKGAVVTSLQKIPDVVLNLKQKKVDAIVLEGPVAQAYLDKNDDLEHASIRFPDLLTQPAVAISKEAPVLLEKVNQSIQTINEEKLLDGYQKEANQYMLSDERGFFAKYAPFYMKGAGYTIFLAFVGVLFGSVIGMFLALCKVSSQKIIRLIASIYIEYVRGTPLLVQIFIVYFGSGILGLEISRVAAGCIALSLNSGAYVAEVIRAGIIAVNKGQREAARSLGMTSFQSMRFIIMPQAVKNILPALGNEFVTVIKESSVVSVIGVSELIFQTGNIQGASFKPFLPYVIVSLIYFVLTFSLSQLLGIAERRMNTND